MKIDKVVIDDTWTGRKIQSVLDIYSTPMLYTPDIVFIDYWYNLFLLPGVSHISINLEKCE